MECYGGIQTQFEFDIFDLCNTELLSWQPLWQTGGEEKRVLHSLLLVYTLVKAWTWR